MPVGIAVIKCNLGRMRKVVSFILTITLGVLLLQIVLLPFQADRLVTSSTTKINQEIGLMANENVVNQDPIGLFSTDCSPDPVPIFTFNGDQINPAVAYDSVNNKYLVVWQDNKNGESHIYGRLMAEGCPYSGSFKFITISEGSSGDETLPDVVYNPDLQQYFVIWHNAAGVRGRRFTYDGEPLDNYDQGFFYNDSSKVYTNSVVTYDSINERYLLLSQRREDANSRVRLKRIKVSDLNSSSSHYISSNAYSQKLGDVAHSSTNTNLGIWSEATSEGYDVVYMVAQRFDGTGETISSPIKIPIPSNQLSFTAVDFNLQWSVLHKSPFLPKPPIFRWGVDNAAKICQAESRNRTESP